MKNLRTMSMPAVSFALVGALSLGVLGGCGTSANDTSTEAAATDEAADEAATDQDATTTEGAAEDAPEAPADSTIDAGPFTFELPEQWVGKVEVSIQEENGQPSALVSLPGNSEAKLATLTYHTDGEDPMIGGDIGSHLAGHAKGSGTRVEVWTLNWPWLVAANSAPSGVSEAELRTLVELSSGGTLSYDDVVGADAQSVSQVEYEFTESNLVPTVVVK